MAMFKPSAESAIFRKFYAKLYVGIQMDLNPFAVNLYSAELISSEIRDNVILMSVAPESRASTLLNAIETGIKNSESVFWKFLEILEVFQKDLAAKLKAEGEKFQKTSEQYYGTDLPGSVPKFIEKEGVINSRVHYGPQPSPGEISGKASPSLCGAGSPTQLHESDDNKRVVVSTDFANNSRGLTMHYGPQPGPGETSQKASPSLSGGLPKQLLPNCHESDGNKESRKYKNLALAMATAFIIFASAGGAQQCAYLYIPKVQVGYDAKASTLATAAQECAAVYVSELRKYCDDHYYRKQLEFSESKCKAFEKEPELTRKELEQCKSAHQKETEHLESQIESGKKQLQCTEQNRPLREKDSELEENKQKLGEKDDLLHRMEADLNEMKVRLQQKEMELPTS